MNEIRKKAENDAEKELKSYIGKDYDFLVKKFVEYDNRENEIYLKYKDGPRPSDEVVYDWNYCSKMKEDLKYFLCCYVVKEAGYEKDKNGFWKKKKKGLFR